MADFVKLNGYSVKDALAGKSLSISGNQLSLLKADGIAASTVTIPAGMKVYHVGLQYKDTVTDQTQYDSILDAVNLGAGSWSVFSITEVLTGDTIATTTKLKDLMKDGLVYVTASILFTAQGTNTWYSLDTHILDSRVAFTISNGVPLYVQGWVSVAINTNTNDITTTSITKLNAGGGGGSTSLKTNIIAEVDSMDWQQVVNPKTGIPANDNFGIGIVDSMTQKLSVTVKQLAMSISGSYSSDVYASFEDYIADVSQAGTSFVLTSWYVYNQNTIYKAQANCNLNTSTMTFDVANVNMTTVSHVGQ